MSSLRPEILTWTGLLGQWVRFAQASLALPPDAQGSRWRTSVPAVINLQAVTFALADLEKLAADERALALDKARLLIDGAVSRLERAWNGEIMPALLSEIRGDAQRAWQCAGSARGQTETQSRIAESDLRRHIQ